MIRVVIVEDEMLVRIGLKMCIGRYNPELTVVEDFSNAEDTLEYFEKNTADVLVTDIRLNGMSGLDLIRELQRRHHNMVLIILSCYEDFSYAKEAIELGVNKYLLKHEVGEEELPQMIMEQYRKKKYDMSKDAWGYMTKVAENEDNDMGEAFQIATFVFRAEGDSRNTSMDDINYEILTELLQKHLKDDALGECFMHHDQEVCVLFRFQKKADIQNARVRIERFWREASISVQNYFNRNAYMIVSKPYYDLKNTKEEYIQVLEKADRSFYYENPTGIWLEDDGNMTGDQALELKLLRENIFQESWCQDMKYEIGLFLKRCCTAGITAKEAKYRIIRLLNEIELHLEQNYKGLTFGEIFGKEQYLDYREVESYDSSEQLQKELQKTLEKLCFYIQDKKEEIYMIEQYIRKNYAKQITLTDMADAFHMSPVYFCQYFKKKKGITYLQFLNQIRIDAAKELLQKRELSVEQISEKVGISNANYFGRLFKKVAGMTVGEYRKLKK